MCWDEVRCVLERGEVRCVCWCEVCTLHPNKHISPQHTHTHTHTCVGGVGGWVWVGTPMLTSVHTHTHKDMQAHILTHTCSHTHTLAYPVYSKGVSVSCEVRNPSSPLQHVVAVLCGCFAINSPVGESFKLSPSPQQTTTMLIRQVNTNNDIH